MQPLEVLRRSRPGPRSAPSQRVGHLDDLHDRRAEAPEALAVPVGVALADRRRGMPLVASAAEVRSKSPVTITKWSIASAPLSCRVVWRAGSVLTVVGRPSIASVDVDPVSVQPVIPSPLPPS